VTRQEDKSDLHPVAFPDVAWDELSREDSLEAVYRWVEEEAVRAVEWYLREKRWKAVCSRALRILAVVGATAGAALPFIVRSGSLGFEWGYFSLAVAAGAVAMDRFFGFSSAWMRYMTAELAIQARLQELRFTRASLLMARGSRPLTADTAADYLASLAESAATIAEELRNETLSWAEEFQVNVAELRVLAKAS
jgi:hypothetical protein